MKQSAKQYTNINFYIIAWAVMALVGILASVLGPYLADYAYNQTNTALEYANMQCSYRLIFIFGLAASIISLILASLIDLTNTDRKHLLVPVAIGLLVCGWLTAYIIVLFIGWGMVPHPF